MITQISNSMSTSAVSRASARPLEQQASRDLRHALRAGDLDAAKQAYSTIVSKAPNVATWNPESSFAQIGKALDAGDMRAAQSAYVAMIKSHLPRIEPRPMVTQPTEPPTMAPGQISLTA